MLNHEVDVYLGFYVDYVGYSNLFAKENLLEGLHVIRQLNYDGYFLIDPTTVYNYDDNTLYLGKYRRGSRVNLTMYIDNTYEKPGFDGDNHHFYFCNLPQNEYKCTAFLASYTSASNPVYLRYTPELSDEYIEKDIMIRNSGRGINYQITEQYEEDGKTYSQTEIDFFVPCNLEQVNIIIPVSQISI